MNNFEDLIRSHVNFSYGISGQGWNTTYCEYCGDGKRTKGPRGGWSFMDSGNTAFYHCFNCGCNESFSNNREIKFSKDMTKVLDAFGVPKSEYLSFLLDKSKNNFKKTPVSSYKHIDLPDYMSVLDESDISKECKKFIRSNYGLSVNAYSFMYGTGKTSSKDSSDISICNSLKGRVIIPFYYKGKPIYYQARDITGNSKNKYLSPNIPKSNIIFNADLLSSYDEKPLYVTEGAFDAIHLDGIAVLGNELSSQQEELLNKSKRRKVLVPDFNGDSNKLAEQFIKNGWEISMPEYSKTCKDVSEAVLKYGRLFTFYDISKNINSARKAQVLMGML